MVPKKLLRVVVAAVGSYARERRVVESELRIFDMPIDVRVDGEIGASARSASVCLDEIASRLSVSSVARKLAVEHATAFRTGRVTAQEAESMCGAWKRAAEHVGQ